MMTVCKPDDDGLVERVLLRSHSEANNLPTETIYFSKTLIITMVIVIRTKLF